MGGGNLPSNWAQATGSTSGVPATFADAVTTTITLTTPSKIFASGVVTLVSGSNGAVCATRLVINTENGEEYQVAPANGSNAVASPVMVSDGEFGIGTYTVRLQVRAQAGTVGFANARINAIALQGSGVTGAAGVTGPAGSALALGQVYQNGGTAAGGVGGEIRLNATIGPVRLVGSGAASGGVYFQVADAGGGFPLFEVREGSGRGVIMIPRIELGGTPLTPANFSLSRWGSGASSPGNYGVTGVSCSDSGGSFTIVGGATGYTINPLITINFQDGPRVGNPFVLTRTMAPCVPTLAPLWGYSVCNPVLVTQSPTFITMMIPGSATARCIVTVQFVSFA